MANYLKADAVSIECELEQYLQPDQLNTVKGRSLLDKVSNRYNRPFLIHFSNEQIPCYVCRQLDIVTGYVAGAGPSMNPAALGKILSMSHCLVQVDLYNKHFANPAATDYNGSLTLRCHSGDTVDLIFSSHVMQYFSTHLRTIITVFAPALPGLTPLATPLDQKLLFETEQERFFEKLQKLPPTVQQVFRYIGEGKGDKFIMDKINKGRTVLSGYVRQLKDEYQVEDRYSLMLIYRKLMP